MTEVAAVSAATANCTGARGWHAKALAKAGHLQFFDSNYLTQVMAVGELAEELRRRIAFASLPDAE